MFTAIGVLAVTAFIVILRGWVLTQLWAWFVTPTFGLPALGIVAAVGLSMIVRYFSGTGSADGSDSDIGKLFGKSILNSVFFLVFGWIISLFM